VGAGGALSPKTPPTVRTADFGGGIAVSPDGKSVYVTGSVDGAVFQFDVRAGGLLSPKAPPTVPAGPGVFDVVVSPILPTAGDDVLIGTAGENVICGLGGSDRISGHAGDDTLFGDRCGSRSSVARRGFVRRGNDRLNGGPGRDRLGGASGRDRLNGGARP
jgi:Ca2+-binding RTX toxin-like protein